MGKYNFREIVSKLIELEKQDEIFDKSITDRLSELGYVGFDIGCREKSKVRVYINSITNDEQLKEILFMHPNERDGGLGGHIGELDDGTTYNLNNIDEYIAFLNKWINS